MVLHETDMPISREYLSSVSCRCQWVHALTHAICGIHFLKCLNPKQKVSTAIARTTLSLKEVVKMAEHFPTSPFLLSGSCTFHFVYSSWSESTGFDFCCLNLLLTTLIHQHKRMKETKREKNTLFILGMSQLPGQHY